MTPSQHEDIKNRYEALIKDRRGFSFHEWTDCAMLYLPGHLKFNGFKSLTSMDYKSALKNLECFENNANRPQRMTQAEFDKWAKNHLEETVAEVGADHPYVVSYVQALKAANRTA